MMKTSILIVEDDWIVAEDIRNRLEAFGFATTEKATSGAEAIEIATKSLPDIVLMDIELGGDMDGIEAASLIESNLHIPVVFITGHTDWERISRASISWPFGYVIKPFYNDELNITIETTQKAYKAHRQNKEAQVKQRELLRLQQILLNNMPPTTMLLRPLTREIIACNEAGDKVGAVAGKTCHSAWWKNGTPCPRCLAPDLWNTGQAQHALQQSNDGYWDCYWIPVTDDIYLHYHCDITDRKRIEDEKTRLESELRRKENFEQLANAAKKLAHDLNNALTPILIQAQLAKLVIEKSHPIQANLSEIFKAGNHTKEMVKDFLSLMKQNGNGGHPTEMTLVVRETLRQIRSFLPPKIEIREIIEVTSDAVSVDGRQLHQLLMELCADAAIGMTESGGVLEVRLDDLDLTSGLADSVDLPSGQYIKLTISDEDAVHHIYSEKLRADLALAEGVVRSMGGALKVNISPEEGNSFTLLLPKIMDLCG